jgi:AAA family ATP:ADP antiporter
MLLYAKMSNRLSQEKIFYTCLIPFLAFFGLFAAVIYPNIDTLQPSHAWVKSIQTAYPAVKDLVAIWGNWAYSIFYILAELWGSVILSLLFFQFANSFITKMEAKRFYPLFGFIGNIGLVFSGQYVNFFATKAAGLSGVDPMSFTLNGSMGAVVVNGFIILALYWLVNRKVVDKMEKRTESQPKTKKTKLSLTESFKYILHSPHLICIALLVFCYGVTINFVDVLWKGQVKVFTAGDKNAFAAYMGDFSTMTGFITMALMIVGGNILRRFSWLQAASIVPVILLITGLGFFGLVIYGTYTDTSLPVLTVFGTTWTVIALTVQFGYWQNSITKASKYSLFDSTKEMAYIPLDDELRTKGKAAVDVVGGRTGKSGGSLIFMIFGVLLPNMSQPQLAPYLAVVFVVIVAVWLGSLLRLNRELNALENKKQDAEKTAEAVPQAA